MVVFEKYLRLRSDLWKLYSGIAWHVTSRVRLSDRGFAAGEDGEALITSIQIKEIDREVG